MSDQQIDPEKLNEKIQSILANESGEIKDPVALNLDPTVVERLSQRESVNQGRPVAVEGEEENTEFKDPDRGRESRAFQSPNPENAGIKAWSLQMPELKREHVEPSSIDKALYLKAMLNDTRLILPINIPAKGLQMEIRSVNNFEQDVIFQALEQDQRDKEVVGPAQYVTRMQYYAGVMQIVEFNKTKQDYVQFDPKENITTIEAASVLREKTKIYIGSNNWPTWQVKLTGLRIFEEKLALCNRSVLDENFWNPAGTD